jgi:hypothetical protein
MFSGLPTAEYGGGIFSLFDRGGGGRMPLLLDGGLGFRVRLSCSAMVSEESCFVKCL